MRSLLLVGAAIAAAATGCTGSSAGAPTVTPATTTPPHTSAAPVPTISPSSPVTLTGSPSPTSNVPPTHTDFGYIQSLDHVSGIGYLKFDRAIFLTGDAANKAAAAHGLETPVPNDYYIVNDVPTIYTYQLAPSVKLVESVVLQSGGYQGHDKLGPLSDLEQFLADNPKTARAVPFHLHFDSAGHVDKIAEQFVP